MTQRDGMGREVGGGFRMGNTCTPMADSCQCIAKPIQYCKVKKNNNFFKASILWWSAFFMVQLSHLYMIIGKSIALTVGIFLVKWCLVLSRFVIAFLPRSKQGSFNFLAAFNIFSDSGAKENKIYHCFHFFPIYLPRSDVTRGHDLSFLNAEF